MSIDLDACYKTAIDVSKLGCEMIREAFSAEKRIQTKATAADLVTETDQKVEALIISTLREKFPTHSFIGEESVAAGEKCEFTDNPTWIIDPIDGTTNFVHRFPFTCISIGLAVNKEIEIGIVYNPILEQFYHARRGKGAFCNDTPIQVAKTEDLRQSLICAEFGSGRESQILDSKLRTMRKIIDQSHGIRSMGSCALAMCAVAAGNADAYYEYGIHVWDMAAAELIVREAGGVVTDPKGGPLDLLSRGVLCAGTAVLAQQLSQCIEPIEMERD